MLQPQARYSNDQITDMILALGAAHGNLSEAAREYNRMRPLEAAPHVDTIKKYVTRLRETGQFHHERHKVSRVTSDAAPGILAFAAANPHASVRDMARASGVSKSTVWNILHSNKFHPYHVSLHQALEPGDAEKRVDFANFVLNMFEEDEDFPLKVMFTDEANFSRDAQVNLHNAHYWSLENPHWLREAHFQRKWSINVWAGIFNGSVVGPHFIDGNLTGSRYRAEILGTVVDGNICEMPLALYREMHFQHDGAPPHITSEAKRWLDAVFPGKWIGRGSNILWPPRSPDLNPMDFFFWGYLKDIVYAEEAASPDVLKQKVTAACNSMTRDQLYSAAKALIKRCQMCIGEEGGHFEHL